MSIVGKVESFWRYPVKNMRGEEMDELFAGYGMAVVLWHRARGSNDS